MINLTKDIHCVNFVTNVIWIMTNSFDTYAKIICIVTSVMLMDCINITGKKKLILNFVSYYFLTHFIIFSSTMWANEFKRVRIMYTCCSSYDFLREHFKKDHYLCEEGSCYEEKFTSAFRSEIDLKGKNMLSFVTTDTCYRNQSELPSSTFYICHMFSFLKLTF